MKWNKKTTSFAVLIGLVIMLMIVRSFFSKAPANPEASTFLELSPTSIIDKTANLQFSKTAAIDSSYEMNGGLTIERIGSATIVGIPTPAPNYVSLLIKNHTQEPIVFDDIGFGVQVFQYWPTPPEWTRVIMPYVPEKTTKTLPPKTESFDFKVLNSWEFNDQDFTNVKTNMVRILVKGRGESSGQNYGAYVDVTLQK